MNRLLRLTAVLALLMGAGLTLASPASAADDPTGECVRQAAGYEAAGVCQLTVRSLKAVCVDDIAKVSYDVTAEGTPNTTVTITFVNPSGPAVVYADQPLSGSVNWPGTVVGADGKGVDWAGWTQKADGTWIAGDEFSWTLPSVQVRFKVNPEASATLAYPDVATGCAPARSEVLSATVVSASTSRSGVLAATGSEATPVLLLGGGLVAVGAGVLVTLAVLRRRRTI